MIVVVKIDNNVDPNSISVVGPFETMEQASLWVERNRTSPYSPWSWVDYRVEELVYP